MCYNWLQSVAVCCSVLQCVAVWCSLLQYVAVCCSVVQEFPVHNTDCQKEHPLSLLKKIRNNSNSIIFQHSAKLAPTQCVALGCMQVTQTNESFFLLQHAATHCNTLQHNTGVSLVFIHMISRRETWSALPWYVYLSTYEFHVRGSYSRQPPALRRGAGAIIHVLGSIDCTKIGCLLQCVAVCYSVLQCVAVSCADTHRGTCQFIVPKLGACAWELYVCMYVYVYVCIYV